MIKLAANAALVTRISFINEIANVCEASGADVLTVAEGIGSTAGSGPRSCAQGSATAGVLPEGLARAQAARRELRLHFQLLNAVIEVNELQKRRVVGKLERHLGCFAARVRAPRARFQAGTDDMREAPSLVLAGRLLAEGARCAPGTRSRMVACTARRRVAASALEALDGADAAVVVTEWPSSASSTGPKRARGCATRLSSTAATCSIRTQLRALGFAYEGIGRADRMTVCRRSSSGARARVEPAGGIGTASHARRTCSRSSTGRSSHTHSSISRRYGVERGSHLVRRPAEQIEEAFGVAYGGLEFEYASRTNRSGPAGDRVRRERDRRSFFALNGDSLRDADLGELVAFHRATGAKATILLTPVADPSRYGLVRPAPTAASRRSSRSHGPRRSTPTSSTRGSTSSSRTCSS